MSVGFQTIHKKTWTFFQGVLAGGPLVVGWGFQTGHPLEGGTIYVHPGPRKVGSSSLMPLVWGCCSELRRSYEALGRHQRKIRESCTAREELRSELPRSFPGARCTVGLPSQGLRRGSRIARRPKRPKRDGRIGSPWLNRSAWPSSIRA